MSVVTATYVDTEIDIARTAQTAWLYKAFAFSVLVHVLVFLYEITDFKQADLSTINSSKKLDVVLVNYKSQDIPIDPQALAQVNLVGGGDTKDKRLATTNRVENTQYMEGNDDRQINRRVAYIEREKKLLLARVKTNLALFDEQVELKNIPLTPGSEVYEKRMLLQNQIGRVAAFIEQQNQEPRRRYIAPSTQEVVFARYYDRVKGELEIVGTENFPNYLGKRLYGDLIIAFTVNSTGKLIQNSVAKSSGNILLDRRALAIVERVAPFPAFDNTLKSSADQLVIIAQFSFHRGLGMRITMKAEST